MRRRIIAIILSCILVIALGGCNDNDGDNHKSKDKDKVEDVRKDEDDDKEQENDTDKEDSDTGSNIGDNKEDNTEEEKVIEQRKVEYLKYGNGRYGFEIEYPSFLIPQREPDNGDGRRFESEDGKVILVASGINNAINLDMEGAFEFYTKDIDNIVYQNIGERSLVVSWEENGVLNYQCVVVGKGSINEFTISYPKEEEDFYNDIVSRCYESFTPGDVEKSH